MLGKYPSRQITWLNFQAAASSLCPTKVQKNTGYPPKESGLDIFLKSGK